MRVSTRANRNNYTIHLQFRGLSLFFPVAAGIRDQGIRKMAKEFNIPASRTSRLFHLGKLAGGLAGGAMAEGLRQLGSGKLPGASDLLLTPANAKRLAKTPLR